MDTQPERLFSLVVLAAGRGRRFGSFPKMLAPLSGKPLLAHVLQAASAAAAELPTEKLLVLGWQAEAVEKALRAEGAELLAGWRILFNPRFAEGQGSSVALAARELNSESTAALYLMGDQRILSPQLIPRILAAGRPEAIVQPRYAGRSGAPCLFSRHFYEELAALQGESGGRQVIQEHPQAVLPLDLDPGWIGADIDTPEDYRQAKEEADAIWIHRPSIR